MGRFAILGLGIGLVVVPAACSSGAKHAKSSTASTTTAASASTSTSKPASPAPPASSTVTTTTANAHARATTVPIVPSASVSVTGFTYIGANPVACNAPTMMEVKWTSKGATRVELAIDGGGVFASYPNGAHDELLPLTCDGKTHTYVLTASAEGSIVRRSVSVKTTKTS